MTDHERAYWLADKIPAYGDYAKEAACVLRKQADEIDRLTRELAELTADRDSWIEQASQRAQETVEAMQQVDAYRMRCEAQDSAPFELVAVEDPDAGTIYRMGERIAELEAEVAALHSAPREPLTDEQCTTLIEEADGTELSDYEFIRLVERAIASQPVAQREPLTKEQRQTILNTWRGRDWRSLDDLINDVERAHKIGADAGDACGEAGASQP